MHSKWVNPNKKCENFKKIGGNIRIFSVWHLLFRSFATE